MKTHMLAVMPKSLRAFAVLALTVFSHTASAGTVSSSQSAPAIDGADLANYGEVTSTDKWWASAGAEGYARGQSFKTEGGALLFKAITYQTSTGTAPTKSFTIRIGKINGTAFTPVYSETATQNASWSAGDYVTWTFTNPPILEGNTIYGVDVGCTSSTTGAETGAPYLNLTENEFPGGARYTSGTGTAGIGGTTVTPTMSDAIFHLDLEAPLGGPFALVAGNPPDNATAALIRPEMVATFSRNLAVGTGNITIRNLTESTETSLAIDDPAVSISNNLLKLESAGLIQWSKDYAIRISPGALLDETNTPFAGITDDTTWNFTTAAGDPFLNALSAIAKHFRGTGSVNSTQLAAHFDTIVANKARFSESSQTIAAVFDLVAAYEEFRSTTVLRIDFSDRNTQTKNFDWTLFHVMQGIMDEIYTAPVLAAHEALLNGFKLGVSAQFPGPCPPPADPTVSRTVSIQGSFQDTFGRHTQQWTTPARKPTGTYLAPGTIVTVTVPPSLVNKGYKVRVGCHSWDIETRRIQVYRLDRATTLFPITATTTKIASPYGGGIYIEVPFGANAGVVDVTITGAARAPYFSAKSFHTTTASEWLVERTHPAPWADFQSDKFMMQVPTKWIYALANPTTLMANWDKAMDAQNELMGFPLLRGKETQYPQVDIIMRYTAYAPGYPSVNNTDNPNTDRGGNHSHYLVRGPNINAHSANVEFHEQGHAYFFPKFAGEMESNVNLAHVAILNRKFNYSLDAAFRGSLGSTISYQTLETAAMAWMCVFNFSPRNSPMDAGEKAYQLKGHAKFVDIAKLYGWDCLGNYWRSFMLDEAAGLPTPTDTDALLLRLSRHVGKDIRPLFHFWGVFPENPNALAAALAAENIPPDIAIRDRLLHYKTLVPANNAAFRTFASSWWGKQPTISGNWEEREHARQWDQTALFGTSDQQRADITVNEEYIEPCAAQIRDRVQEIVDLYYPNNITPNPLGFSVPPSGIDPTTIRMVANTANAAFGPIQYYFENITNNTNSGWITNPAWDSNGLTTGASYAFRVKARDGFLNETSWSETFNATAQNDSTAPAPDPMTFGVMPTPVDTDEITMTATAAADVSGVAYYFACLTEGGHDSGWQDSPTYTDTGLAPGTPYSYRVRARDKSAAQNITGWSAMASATTDVPDETPPVIVSLTPADNAGNVLHSTTSLSVIFDEFIISSNSGAITLKNLTDSTESIINIADETQVSISGTNLTLLPQNGLLPRKSYAIRIDPGTVKDVSGNLFAGITDDTTWNFSTAGITCVWTQTTGNAQSWNTAANWQGNAVPSPTTGDTVDFSSANITANTTLTLGADRTARLWKFGDATTASHDWIIDVGNSMVLAGTTPTIEVVNRTATLSNVVDGAAGLVKSGTGTLVLTNGSNAFSGGLTIEGGNVSTQGATTDPLGETNNTITVKANTSLTLGDGFTTLAKSIVLNNNSVLSFVTGGGSPRIITGAVSGMGGIAVNTMGSLGQRTLTLQNGANSFTGPITQVSGNFADVTLNSLNDDPGAGAITYGEAGQARTMRVSWGSGASTPLVLNDRVLAITGTTTTAIFNNDAATANTVTISTNLSVLTTGAKTFTLGGSNTGNNLFAGNISNGAGSVAITKSGAGTWNISGNLSHTGGISVTEGNLYLAGTNTYSGATGGPRSSNVRNIVFQGMQALSANTTLDYTNGGGIGTAPTFRILHDGTGTFSKATNITSGGGESSTGMTLFVGNNGAANLGNGAGGTTGSTIALGDFIASSITSHTLSVTGANDYRLQINNVTSNVSNTATGLFTVALNPTTAPITVAGNVRQAVNTNNLNAAARTNLTLDGTAAGNFINGNILDSADTTAKVLSLTKSNTSVWTLSGANTYTGSTTINGGKLSINSIKNVGGGVSAVGAPTTAANGTIAMGSTTTTATLIYTGTGDQTDRVINLTGTTGGAILDQSGASGLLKFTSNFTATGAGAKTLTLQGSTAGTGEIAGAIANSTTTTAVTKLGTGRWILSGPNTYTGTTTVSAGKFFINGNQSTATGTVSVSANATLGGTGTIGGSTTIATNGKLEFDLSTNAGSHDKLELASGKTLTFSGASTLTITSSGGASPGTYTLVSAPGGITGNAPAALNLPADWAATVSKIGNNLVLDVTYTGGPGPVASFEISPIISPQIVGTPITGITITAKDASNVTATGFTGTVTFGGTGGFTGTSTNFVAGVLTNVSITPTVAGNNVTFTVNNSLGQTGTTTIASVQTQYAAWSGGEAFDADTNKDGIENGMAWLLGATNLSANAHDKLPVASRNGGNLRFAFRCLKSTKRGSTQLKVQSSNDLGVTDLWANHQAEVPDTDNVVNGVVFDITDNGDFIYVIADMPVAGDKLFGRLQATP